MKNREKITDHLSDIKKENPFDVPGSYFEDFNSRLKQRLNEEDIQKEIQSSVRRLPRYSWVVGAAAVVAGIMLAVKLWVVKPQVNEWSDAEIAVIIQDELYDMDEFDLEAGINQTHNTTLESVSFETDSYKNEIINYLIDEQIDVESIVSEL